MTHIKPTPPNAGRLAAADLLHDLMYLEPEGPGPGELLGSAIYDLIIMGKEGRYLEAVEYLEGFTGIIGPLLLEGIERAEPELRQPDLEAAP